MKGVRLNIFSHILFLLFLCYYAGNNLFWHVHDINGVIIIHSHLNADPEHTHSSTDITFIDEVNNFSHVNIVNSATVVASLLFFALINEDNYLDRVYSIPSGRYSVRPPPYTFIS